MQRFQMLAVHLSSALFPRRDLTLVLANSQSLRTRIGCKQWAGSCSGWPQLAARRHALSVSRSAPIARAKAGTSSCWDQERHHRESRHDEAEDTLLDLESSLNAKTIATPGAAFATENIENWSVSGAHEFMTGYALSVH